VALLAARIAQRLTKITVPPGHRLGKPWLGAWAELHRRN